MRALAIAVAVLVGGCCASLRSAEVELYGVRAKVEFALEEATAPPTCEPHCDAIAAKEAL